MQLTMMPQQRLVEYANLVKAIQDALGTAEFGDALVEVARNAHKAEQELAVHYRLSDMN